MSGQDTSPREGDGAAGITAEHHLTYRDRELVATEFKQRHLKRPRESETGRAGSYARPCNRARKHRLRPRASALRPTRDHRLLAADEEAVIRSEEHTSELQSLAYLVCRLLLEKKKQNSELTY